MLSAMLAGDLGIQWNTASTSIVNRQHISYYSYYMNLYDLSWFMHHAFQNFRCSPSYSLSGNSQGQPQRYLDQRADWQLSVQLQLEWIKLALSRICFFNYFSKYLQIVFHLCDEFDEVTWSNMVQFSTWIRLNFTVFKHVVSWDVLVNFKEFRWVSLKFLYTTKFYSLVSVWCLRLVLLLFFDLVWFHFIFLSSVSLLWCFDCLVVILLVAVLRPSVKIQVCRGWSWCHPFLDLCRRKHTFGCDECLRSWSAAAAPFMFRDVSSEPSFRSVKQKMVTPAATKVPVRRVVLFFKLDKNCTKMYQAWFWSDNLATKATSCDHLETSGFRIASELIPARQTSLGSKAQQVWTPRLDSLNSICDCVISRKTHLDFVVLFRNLYSKHVKCFVKFWERRPGNELQQCAAAHAIGLQRLQDRWGQKDLTKIIEDRCSGFKILKHTLTWASMRTKRFKFEPMFDCRPVFGIRSNLCVTKQIAPLLFDFF